MSLIYADDSFAAYCLNHFGVDVLGGAVDDEVIKQTCVVIITAAVAAAAMVSCAWLYSLWVF